MVFYISIALYCSVPTKNFILWYFIRNALRKSFGIFLFPLGFTFIAVQLRTIHKFFQNLMKDALIL